MARERSGEKQGPPPANAGRWQKGTSGNPAGRPKGRGIAHGDPRAVARRRWRENLRRLIEQAKSGEPWAVRLCVERLLPRHERRVSVELPAVTDAASVGDAIALVIEPRRMVSSQLRRRAVPSRSIEQQRKAIETNEARYPP